MREEVEKMLTDRVIRPSTSPWASPIVLVQKKDGGVRFCVDFRKLNQVAKFDAYPMPRMEEVFESIGSSTVVTTLDLASGYWQIPLAPGSREKTAFATPFGLFEFEVMPFGLHNAPATFQRMMDHVLRDCQEFARAYIDDIAVFSHSWEEHLSHLGQVLNRLQLAGLTVKLKKSIWRPGSVLSWSCDRWWKAQAQPEQSESCERLPSTSDQEGHPSIPRTCGLLQTFHPSVCHSCCPVDGLDAQMSSSTCNLEC